MNEQKGRPEGIRQWYQRTTSLARKVLFWLAVLAIAGAVIAFFFMPETMTGKLQAFNSAVTTPTAIFLWTFGLLFMFLIPQRESGFRSQEWVELLVTKVVPVVKTWDEIGEKVKAELPAVLDDMKATVKKASETMDELRVAAKRLMDAVGKNEKTLEDAKPVVEALKRIESRIEIEIHGGLFENVKAALASVRSLGGLPPSEAEEDLPNMAWALNSIRTNKAKAGVKA